MSSVAIRFAESAIADLESIRAWYAEQGVPEVGDRLIEEIVSRIGVLREDAAIDLSECARDAPAMASRGRESLQSQPARP